MADDHPLYRDGVVRSLNDAGGFEVVAEAASADEAVARAAETAPDLVLLDISMPGGGHAALRQIHAADPRVRVRDADGLGRG